MGGRKKIQTRGSISTRNEKTPGNKKSNNKPKKVDFKRLPKGYEGEQKWFMCREDAIKKLGLSPEEFLKICIFKGVHPREPKKKFGRPNQTYYHTKDIDYMKNDPVLNTLKEMKTFDRKFSRFVNRKEFDRAQNYKDWFEPYFNLARMVKERYPTFEEAIRAEMDDCLSTLCLVAQLPADKQTGFNGRTITTIQRLLDEFYFHLARKNSVKKGFISKKGFYLTADVAGIDVTWCHPFDYSLDTSEIVDFAPMQHFSEYYLTLMKFVNYKLYHDDGLVYPPPRNKIAEEAGIRFLSVQGEALEENSDDSASDAEADTTAEEDAFQKVRPLLGRKIILNREVPLQVFGMVLQSMGAEIGWQESAMTVSKLSPVKVDDPTVTYHIYDRPALPKESTKEAFKGRTYLQPQWVFDTLNKNAIANLDDYRCGIAMPVHLSPYHDYVSPNELAQIAAEEENMEHTEETKLRKSMMTSKSRWLYGLKDRKKMMTE